MAGVFEYETRMRQRQAGRLLLDEDAEAAAADIAVPMPEHASVISSYAKDCIHAALPLAVAAELERMADAMRRLWCDPMGQLSAEQAHAARIMKQDLIAALRRRAESLRVGDAR